MFYRVFICKPLPRPSVYGVDAQQLVKRNRLTGQVIETSNLGRTKAVGADGQLIPEPIKVMLDRNTNTYNIGLSELVDNPFTEETNEIIRKYRLDPKAWKDILESIKTQEKITKQMWAEIRFGLQPDELTERRPPKPTKELGDTRTKIMKTQVILYDEANPFCEDNLNGWLAIQILKHSPRVARSKESGNTATQSWYLVEQQTEQRQNIDAIIQQNKTIAKLAEYNDKYPITSTLEENILYFIASITYGDLSKPIVRDKITPVSIQEKIDEFLKPKQKDKTLSNCESFMKSVKLYEENPELFYARYLAQQMVNKNALQEVNGKWYWAAQKNKQENIGAFAFNSFDNFVNFVYTEMTTLDSKYFADLVKELLQKQAVVPFQIQALIETKIEAPEYFVKTAKKK
jgi:hypothetical protein